LRKEYPVICDARPTDAIRSAVADYLENMSPNSDIGVMFLYCDYKQRAEQTIDNLVASLLSQLIQQKRTKLEDIQSLYEQHKHRRTWWSLVELSKALRSVAATFSELFIVIDEG
jgi:hypothetical protein